MCVRHLVAAGLLVAAACIAPARAQSGPPSLAGAWKLVSWETRQADGSVRNSPMSVGSLMYSDSGRMCGLLMDPSRKPLSGPPADEEIKSAYNGLVAYCGTYEIDAKAGFVVHHVDIEKSPSSVGIARKRWFTLEGDRLSLRVDQAELGANTTESRLVWERVRR
jgi:hypothetical protein